MKVVMGLVLLMAGLALLTQREVEHWSSSQALWRHAWTVNPKQPQALMMQAVSAYQRGDPKSARIWLNHARQQRQDPRRPPIGRRDPLVTLLWFWTEVTAPL